MLLLACRYVAAVSSNAAGVPTKEKRAQELAEKAKKVSSSNAGGLESASWLCAAVLERHAAAGCVRDSAGRSKQ